MLIAALNNMRVQGIRGKKGKHASFLTDARVKKAVLRLPVQLAGRAQVAMQTERSRASSDFSGPVLEAIRSSLRG